MDRRRIVSLDDYHKILQQRTRIKQQNAKGLTSSSRVVLRPDFDEEFDESIPEALRASFVVLNAN